MGASKRKAEHEVPPSKKGKSASSDRSTKRLRKSESHAELQTPSSTKLENAPPKSIFKNEERTFPRGGGSVLTPLEHKQIQIKATQDVLFEQAGLKHGGEDRLSDQGSDVGDNEQKRKASAKRKSKKSKIVPEVEVKEPKVKAGLSSKKLAIGTLVLGQVVNFTSQHVVLALPNGLVGHVPLTAVSDKLNAKIEKLLKDEEHNNADEEDREDTFEDVVLKDMFTTGQYLRACVTSTGEDELPGHGVKAKRRIELSIHPRLVNRGLTKSNIVPNTMIQASVISNEDHGLIMDLGIDDQNVKGFLGKKELGAHVDYSRVQEGAVFLCAVTGFNSDGRIVKLTADHQKIGHAKKGRVLTEAPTIDVFLPGTAVEMLITDLSRSTITGKLLGLIDATADTVHSGAAEKATDLTEKLNLGSKIRVRIIFTLEDSDMKSVGVSLLDHVLSLSSRMSGKPKEQKMPLELAPISSFVDQAKVTRVEPMLGVYFDIGVRDVMGFAHVSRLADGRVETPSEASGPFQLASQHRVRVIGYSAFDGMFQLSLEERVLAQTYLRIDDVHIGDKVTGKVHKLIVDRSGASALLVTLADGITGFVSEAHLADVSLQHPERKFREGVTVSGRVLFTDVERHQVRLSLKKSLVNSDVPPWSDISQLAIGAASPGTLLYVKPSGALVQFYGNLKAWLPAAEMSEAFIDDATRHFTRGQVVNVRVVSIDSQEHRVIVSCKDPAAVDPEKEIFFKSLAPGDITKGVVIEKGVDSVILDVGHGVKGVLSIGHLTDGSQKKDKSTMDRVRVSGTLDDLVVLDKHNKSRTVTLSNKPSLRKAAQAKTLITKFEDIKVGKTVDGFVHSIFPDKVFIGLGGGVSGMLFKSQVTEDMTLQPNFGLRKDQSITARVSHVDSSKGFFWLSLRPEAENPKKVGIVEDLIEPVDTKIKSTADLKFGATISVRVRSVKSTQLNVRISKNINGRIHVSELFPTWDDIKDKKKPTTQYYPNDIIQATIVGVHDSRNYRFLPISHRQGTTKVFELSIKEKAQSEGDLLTMNKISVGDTFMAFVNNVEKRHVWVNVSANVRGRIELFDLTDDLSLLGNVGENFPEGSALKVRVKAVDATAGRLDLTAASAPSTRSLTLGDLKEGLILPARITKLHGSHIVVQINESIAGPVFLEQLADDYDKAKPKDFSIGEIIRVCILEIDAPNKKITLSARPSRVISSSLPVKDPDIADRSSLAIGQVVRGFVKKVADNAVYVRLGRHVDAMVRVSQLSDAYIKDWKAAFEVDKLVTGKIIANDAHLKNPQMSLKQSIIEGEYVKPVSFSDIKRGQIVTAKVRHVEDYGVFLVIDNSENVSGMCHVSQLADKPVEKDKVKELYKAGDAVKAKVLAVDVGKRRISFGLKYSHIKGHLHDNDENSDEEMADASDVEDAASLNAELEFDEDVDMRSVKSAEDSGSSSKGGDSDRDQRADAVATPDVSATGLSTSGFDWSGAALDFDEHKAPSDDSDDGTTRKKKKHKKATIKEDRTGDLDAYGPQSVADYERLLLGQPNSAELWVRYMVFQRELSEIDKARQIARRALATINAREEKERLDVWTALLHLENDFGSDDIVESTLKEACQNIDAREVHERTLKIYISSGKLEKADNLYQTMTKNKSFTPDPALWISYATFLMATLSPPSPARARALLSRATQSVPSSQHRYLTQKFASLEFKLPGGDQERGRTIFENLVSTWPKKGDIWDVYVSLEMSHGSKENVRDLFERMTKVGMKKRRAETVFKRWKEWEEREGDSEGVKKAGKAEAEWKEKKSGKEDDV